MNNFFNFSNYIIKILFYFFIFLTLCFCLTSSNTLLTGNNTTFSTFIIIISILIITFFLVFLKNHQFIKETILGNQKLIALILFSFTVVFQLLYVFNVHPVIGFDAGAIHNALFRPNSSELRGYFSSNVNNIFPLILQYRISKFFNQNSWFFFELLSVIFVDISVLINTLIVILIDYRKAALSIIIQSLWLLFYPMAIIPYTDNWVLPFVSFYLLFAVITFFTDSRLLHRTITAFITGIFFIVSYNTKPSSVIPMVAIILYLFLKAICKKFSNKQLISMLATMIIFFFGAFSTTIVTKHAIQKQTIVQIIPNREVPPIHFIQIGMTGRGGYNAHDALMMSILQTKQAREKYSKEKIKTILKNRGINYLPFLVRKHGYNSSDGTFSWLLEGHFINQKVNYHVHGIKKFFIDFTMPNGKNLYNYKFIAQLLWINIILILAFSFKSNTPFVQVMRLSIVGSFVYLLIFEGGRSRFFIQFLPTFFIMWSLVFNEAHLKIKQIINQL